MMALVQLTETWPCGCYVFIASWLAKGRSSRIHDLTRQSGFNMSNWNRAEIIQRDLNRAYKRPKQVSRWRQKTDYISDLDPHGVDLEGVLFTGCPEFEPETGLKAIRLLYEALARVLPIEQTAQVSGPREIRFCFAKTPFMGTNSARVHRSQVGGYRRTCWGWSKPWYNSVSATARTWTVYFNPIRYLWLAKMGWATIDGKAILDVLTVADGHPAQVVAVLSKSRNNHRAALCTVRKGRGGVLKLSKPESWLPVNMPDYTA